MAQCILEEHHCLFKINKLPFIFVSKCTYLSRIQVQSVMYTLMIQKTCKYISHHDGLSIIFVAKNHIVLAKKGEYNIFTSTVYTYIT